MTADLYVAALAALEARRGRVEQGTPGPWSAPHRPPGPWCLGPCGDPLHGDDGACWGVHVVGPALNVTGSTGHDRARGVGTSALIVAAVNDYPRHLDAFGEVLERHAPDVGYLVSGWSCAWCSDDESRSEAPWPCPDAQSVLRALGVTS